MEVHENVEKDDKTIKQNESNSKTERETVHSWW